MRKVLVILIVTLITIATIEAAFASGNNKQQYIVVTEHDRLRIRLNDDHSVVLGKLKKGQVFTPDWVDRDWAHFTYDGKHAIAYMGYLAKYNPANPSDSGKSSSGQQYVVNVDSRLNFRVEPDLDAKIICTLKNGTKVTVLSTSGSWARIQVGNQTGYVWKSYLKKK